MKGRIEIFSFEPESKVPNEANLDILGVLLNLDMINLTPHSLQTVCVRENVPKSKCSQI